jgi:small subunit ribosomal protein S20
MPNTNSAKKRLRQSILRRNRNRSTKSALRTQLRKVRQAVDAGDAEKAESEFRLAAKLLDKAGSKRVVHPNLAARLKSRLQKRIKAVKAQPSASA